MSSILKSVSNYPNIETSVSSLISASVRLSAAGDTGNQRSEKGEERTAIDYMQNFIVITDTTCDQQLTTQEVRSMQLHKDVVKCRGRGQGERRWEEPAPPTRLISPYQHTPSDMTID